MSRFLFTLLLALAAPITAAEPEAGSQTIVADLIHLRSGNVREWSEFPEAARGDKLEVKFTAAKNVGEFALQVRQQDVKQTWKVSINDKALGTLVIDENDQTLYFPVPAGTLVDGENVLRIGPAGGKSAASDDIRVGQVALIGR
jgi:hypothetical protein